MCFFNLMTTSGTFFQHESCLFHLTPHIIIKLKETFKPGKKVDKIPSKFRIRTGVNRSKTLPKCHQIRIRLLFPSLASVNHSIALIFSLSNVGLSVYLQFLNLCFFLKALFMLDEQFTQRPWTAPVFFSLHLLHHILVISKFLIQHSLFFHFI